MKFEAGGENREKDPSVDIQSISESEKAVYKDAVLHLLQEYPDNFFSGFFEDDAAGDYLTNEIIVAFDNTTPIGCLFINPHTRELNWLAISRKFQGDRMEVSKKMFEYVFSSLEKGTRVFWYVNSEDAVFNGRPVGRFFGPARRLYRDLGANFTKVENKFGEGNHAYLVEYTT